MRMGLRTTQRPSRARACSNACRESLYVTSTVPSTSLGSTGMAACHARYVHRGATCIDSMQHAPSR